MTVLLTADWWPHGRDAYFRKFEVYSMEWQKDPDVNLDRVILTTSKYGGPIAVMRDPSKIVQVQSTGKPVISIYSSSGCLISSFKILMYLLYVLINLLIFVLGYVAPTAWEVVSEDRHTRVLFARGSELYVLNESDQRAIQKQIDLGADNSLIVAMAVSDTQRKLAVMTNYGFVWIGGVDLHHCYRLFDTKNKSPPKELAWCGEDAIAIYRDNNVEIIDEKEDPLNFFFEIPIKLVQELDCVRILSQYNHEILQKVPFVVQEIFRINGTGPGAYLLEASKQFKKRSYRADEYIHLVKPKLVKAVDQCISAAGHEFSAEGHKMLMRAAQYGKCFLAEFNPDPYVEMCRMLRVLNAVRDVKIGIPITCNQLKVIGIQKLLDMLLIRRQYFLAIHIAKHLRLPDSSRILMHWAYYKVQQSQLDREEVASEISEKIKQNPGVSFSEIAMKAADCGKTQLAIKLLDHEKRASLQVPLLLRLGQEQVALQKAVESGNTDLVYTVLLHLRENMPLAKFQMVIRKFALAQALYLKYCREHNRETLRDVYTQEDDHNALAACSIYECYDNKTNSLEEASLSAAQEWYKRAKNEVHAALCEEQLKLRRHQRHLEEKFARNFVDRSLHDTLRQLLLINELKLADKMRAEYRVPERRYWWLRIECLCQLEEWEELEKFSKSKKSPIGYEPFIDALLECGRQHDAQKYMPKVRDELKVKYFCKLGMFDEALQYAIEKRDPDAKKYILAQKQLADKLPR
ncbi:vacuolar protein sorting-associated protein 16 homolog [Nilaparvata lugens]|uniref:vacuolar protein sorting-associated protein 16 homolog n=1 Tax=Nilaparvata lugens TaxID=108931 RepID=UPI00193E1073|nr:vacuolar protein sorting-associated protein 16 homolog [Nilaparvata lugens]